MYPTYWEKQTYFDIPNFCSFDKNKLILLSSFSNITGSLYSMLGISKQALQVHLEHRDLWFYQTKFHIYTKLF